jgi:hypothetical protein
VIASRHIDAREPYRENHDGIMNGRVSALRVMRLRTRQQRS